MKVLVACEYSGIVRDAFKDKGHEAWSCDILATESKGNPLPTVLSLNKTKKQKSGNRRIQITFINPPHHGKGRSGTDYQEVEK